MKRVLLVLVLAGCVEHHVKRAQVGLFSASRDVDVLFVIDSSPGMAAKQDAILASVPAFTRALQATPGGLPSLHVGVVTADLGGPASCGAGDGGVLHDPAGLAGGFLRDDGHDRNYTGAFADVLAQQLHIASTGCGVQQHLEAMKRALDGNPANAGFVRDTAKLGVIVIADRDDCSGNLAQFEGPVDAFSCFREGVACREDSSFEGDHTDCHPRAESALVHPVEPYRKFLLELTGARHEVTFGVLTPPDTVTVQRDNAGAFELGAVCMLAGSPALPAVRLDAFAHSFFELGNTVRSLCEPDLEASMRAQAAMITNLLGSRCLADNAGDCVAFEATPEHHTDIASCDAGVLPCFEVVADPVECAGSSTGMLRAEIRRDRPAPADAQVVVQCVVPRLGA